MRNLQRAAQLILSFKQVAVDQSSDQRRIFDLKETIEEILLTLEPVYKRSASRFISPAGDISDLRYLYFVILPIFAKWNK